ncbi:MAG: ankyrin repeat domain-containing protein [Desulfovibrio sp.]
MNTIPTTEAILLQIHQGLGGKKYQTRKKTKFSTGQADLKTHQEMYREILQDIFTSLALDPEAQNDLFENLLQFTLAYKTVELNTWTFDADQRQIIWMLSAYFYTPGIARHMAFWNLDESLHKGMPGGKFWYLPRTILTDEKQDSVILPLAQVIDWLLDILGMPIEQLADAHSNSTHGEKDSLRRSLYNWRKKTTIQINTINEYFKDDLELNFHGAFLLDEALTHEEQFTTALEFVERKKLTAAKLREEIPMTDHGQLEDILNKKANQDNQSYFVKCLAERYAIPSLKTIRQRFLIARMIQDGYKRMLKFLCPEVTPLCSDPSKNKLLQLVLIYQHIYNLTVEARIQCREQGEHAENIWFQKKLQPWHATGIYLSILPSLRSTSNQDVAQSLTRHFSTIQNDTALEDHFEYDEHSARTIIERNIGRLEATIDEDESITNLKTEMKRKSPWRVLQNEHRFWVVSQIAPDNALSSRAKTAALQRLRELAKTPAETVQAILIELAGYLNQEPKGRSKDVQAKVQSLLNEAESSEGYELWKAAILQYKAKHQLFCNDFKGADKSFRKALEATQDRNFGPIRGEIARDCFAVQLADNNFHPNQKKYFREMLAGGILDDNEEVPPIKEVARTVSNYFWDSLYKPYRGVSCKKPRSVKILNHICEELIDLLSNSDPTDWKIWIKKNQKILTSPLPDVDGNSVIIQLIKMRSTIQKRLNKSVVKDSPINLFTNNWRRFIKQLAEQTPSQLDRQDLKGQTPLMLVAEAGDTELVKAMLKAGANPDLQDWHGMTALHSAIKSHVDGCVDALLDHPCSLENKTTDNQSPLHTASWSTNMHAIKRLLQQAPEQAWEANDYGKTPLEWVEFYIETPEALEDLSRRQVQLGRKAITKSRLQKVVEILEQAPLVQ